MIINRKTILTLAAVATLAAALAPTSASAGFGFGHGGNKFGGSFGHGGNTSGQNLGSFGHNKVGGNFGHGDHNTLASRPRWHRPIEIKVVGGYGYARPHFYAPRTVSYYATPTYSPPTYSAPTTYAAVAPTYAAPRRPIVRPAAQPAVTGENVMLIEVPYARFSMIGEGQWAKDGSGGEHFEFTEDKRDGSSVYLTDASRGVSLQLDLSQKQVYLLGASAKKPVFPILNASADVK